jgi:hypothetical protein
MQVDARQMHQKLLQLAGARFDKVTAKKDRIFVFPNGRLYRDRGFDNPQVNLSDLKKQLLQAGYGHLIKQAQESLKPQPKTLMAEKLEAAAQKPAPEPVVETPPAVSESTQERIQQLRARYEPRFTLTPVEEVPPVTVEAPSIPVEAPPTAAPRPPQTSRKPAVRSLTAEEIKMANNILRHAGQHAYDEFVNDCINDRRRATFDYIPKKEAKPMPEQKPAVLPLPSPQMNPLQVYRMLELDVTRRREQQTEVDNEIKQLEKDLVAARERKTQLTNYIESTALALDAMRESAGALAKMDGIELPPVLPMKKSRRYTDAGERWRILSEILNGGVQLQAGEIYEKYKLSDPDATRGSLDQALMMLHREGKLNREQKAHGQTWRNVYSLPTGGDLGENES